jgi:hypothetical protein
VPAPPPVNYFLLAAYWPDCQYRYRRIVGGAVTEEVTTQARQPHRDPRCSNGRDKQEEEAENKQKEEAENQQEEAENQKEEEGAEAEEEGAEAEEEEAEEPLNGPLFGDWEEETEDTSRDKDACLDSLTFAPNLFKNNKKLSCAPEKRKLGGKNAKESRNTCFESRNMFCIKRYAFSLGRVP